MPRRLDAVHPGHANVEQYHVGRHRGRLAECLDAAASLTDDLGVTNLREEASQPFTRRRLVVDDQYLEHGTQLLSRAVT